MKNRILLAFLVSAGVFAALPAHARHAGGGIQERMDRQAAAIERGIDRGELTREEARYLRHEQRSLNDYAEDLRRQGYPRREAWRRIERRLDRADRHIYELTHNDEVRYRHRRDDRRDTSPRRDSDRHDERRYDERRYDERRDDRR